MNKKSNTITKSQFLEELAASLSITRSEAERTWEIFHKMIYQYLKEGKAVQFSGFGTFSVSHRKARMGVDPRTLKPIEIPAFNNPKFKAGEAFKDAIKLR